MQIITIDDQDFPALLEAFQQAKPVGKYWKNGTVQIVRATSQFLLVSQGEAPRKIAIKPTRGIAEAEHFGVRLLHREKERGSEVEILSIASTPS